MRILIAHNHYSQVGGEDAVVKTESALLQEFNEEVYCYERHNKEIDSYSVAKKINFLITLNWSKQSYFEIKKIIREFQPDVVHFHNIFFMMTPSVYFACKEENVPVVQSQHNFRLLCSNGLFFRNNTVCEECVAQKTLWRGVYHGCYKNSRLMTAFVVNMLEKHWKMETWEKMVDLYVVSSEFSRQKFIQGGISARKIIVKPNCVHSNSNITNSDGSYALYVGRLSAEKGLSVLLEVWKTIPNLVLKVVGTGPQAEELKKLVKNNLIQNVEFLGYVSEDKYQECMKGAKMIIIPSVCYENFPRIIAEAYSYGIPILASRLGSMPELVEEGKTGLLFEPRDSHDLSQKVRWIMTHNDELQAMRKRARQEYEEKYGPKINYKKLMEIYQHVLSGQSGKFDSVAS